MTRAEKTIIIIKLAINPPSSPIAEKIKSVCWAGIKCNCV